MYGGFALLDHSLLLFSLVDYNGSCHLGKNHTSSFYQNVSSVFGETTFNIEFIIFNSLWFYACKKFYSSSIPFSVLSVECL